MLIEFKVGNYCSFREIATFSLLAAGSLKEYEEKNVIHLERYRLLRAAAIYGANASGKSNLLSALSFMRWFVLNSSKEGQIGEKVPVSPFKLDAATEGAPSYFETMFLIENRRYRYGFEVDRNRIHKEWLLYTDKIKETPLFLREMDQIDVRAGFPEGKDLSDKTRENALFLSVAANFNGKIARSVLHWFSKIIPIPVRGARDMSQYRDMSVDLLKSESSKSVLVALLKEADLGINDVSFEEKPAEMEASELRKVFTSDFLDFIRKGGVEPQKMILLQTTHKKYDNGAEVGSIRLNMLKEESDGTIRFFDLMGPILRSLSEGSLVVVDELESSLHPLLTRKLLQLYQSQLTNPKHAQLVFVTHDTNLLNLVEMRRDQIWFTEKNEQGVTDLYSLAEFKMEKGEKVRKDALFAKNYIKGRYGAIPFMGDFDSLVKRFMDGQTDKKN